MSKLVAELDGMQSELFFRSVDELAAACQLKGQISGGRHFDRAVYTPQVYNDMLHAYVLDTYQQNGFLGWFAKLVSNISTWDSIFDSRRYKLIVINLLCLMRAATFEVVEVDISPQPADPTLVYDRIHNRYIVRYCFVPLGLPY